jgi:hypothetical protein
VLSIKKLPPRFTVREMVVLDITQSPFSNHYGTLRPGQPVIPVYSSRESNTPQGLAWITALWPEEVLASARSSV